MYEVKFFFLLICLFIMVGEGVSAKNLEPRVEGKLFFFSYSTLISVHPSEGFPDKKTHHFPPPSLHIWFNPIQVQDVEINRILFIS